MRRRRLKSWAGEPPITLETLGQTVPQAVTTSTNPQDGDHVQSKYLHHAEDDLVARDCPIIALNNRHGQVDHYLCRWYAGWTLISKLGVGIGLE